MSTSVDRSRTCPFLLRCFLRPNAHSEAQLFNPSNPAQQRAEYSIYVWKDTNLRELAILLRSVNPSVLGKGNARFSVRHVYAASPSSSSSSREASVSWDHRDLGVVFARDLTGKNALSSEGHGRNGGRNDPSLKTLEQHRFIPGDFLEVAYTTPTSASGPNSSNGMGPSSNAAPGSIPSMSIHGRAGPGGLTNGGRPNVNSGGLTEADQAWGIAGEQRHRGPAGRGAGSGGFSGGNRFNPLLSGRGGMSILGQSGRRRRQSGEGGEDPDHGRLKGGGDATDGKGDADAMED